MRLDKKAIQSIVVVSSLAVITTIAAVANNGSAKQEPVVAATQVLTKEATELEKNGMAGVVVELKSMEITALDSLEVVTASVEQTQTDVVTAAEDTLTEEEVEWQANLMPNVDQFLNVRAEADENASIVGKLYKGDKAVIVEQSGEWTHITSGNVDGYVKNEYCLFGTDALEYAKTNFDTVATVETNGLRVRSEASEEASVLKAVYEGSTLVVSTETQAPEGWVAVKCDDRVGYVSAGYVTLSLELGVGITIEEEQEAIRKAEEEAAAKAAAQTTATTRTQNAAVAASADDVTLLAAIIQCEAGNECYEGQLAVGAVVMNRVRSGGYPGSIYDVIFQSGQFTPAGNGKVASVVASGPCASCMQAAQEAINGVDNTGGATSFRPTRSGHAGTVIGNHVFF
ncbi:MAG: cell wall hydrolase [Roseburia sp.]